MQRVQTAPRTNRCTRGRLEVARGRNGDPARWSRGSMNEDGARYWIIVTRRGPTPCSTRLPKWKHCVVSAKQTVPDGPRMG